jgi:heme-degrading monooxygenase HmoA
MIVVMFSITPREGMGEEAEEALSERMWAIVSAMPGFISYKAYTAEDGERISVVRFESREALEAWSAQPDHRRAQEYGKKSFYRRSWVQAAETFREYLWSQHEGYGPIPREIFLQGARPPAGQAHAVP